jgi:hypothetical protein
MNNNKQLTIDDFEQKYHPVKNPFRDTWTFDGCQFETYGEDIEYVRSFEDKQKIWTVIDNNDGWFGVVAGYHYINRIGYLITEEKWESEFEEYTICDEGPVNDWFWSLSVEEKKSLFPSLELKPNLHEEDQLEDEWHDNCVDEKEEIMMNFKNKNNE